MPLEMNSPAPNNAGRPSKLSVPYPYGKTLWEGIWGKFCADHADSIKNLTLSAKLELLAQKANVGVAPIKELKKDVEQASPPETVGMSQTAITGLCDYISDEDLKRNIIVSIEDPEAIELARYFGRYRVYWREKRQGAWLIRNSLMQLGAADTRVWGGLADVSVGKRIELQNMNLFCSVADVNKISQFVFNVGTVVENNLRFVPGLCTTINASAVPTMVAVLLVREGLPDSELGEPFLNRYFDCYNGRSLLHGVSIDWFLNPSDYRIGGLFGNWYIYAANANGIIRRAKICIISKYNLHYQGTRHEFKKGRVDIFNHTCAVLDLDNDYKHLHLIGRVGDGSDLRSRNRIPCIYSSTGNEGQTLKSGVSLMLREPDVPYEEMSTQIFTPDNYPPDLPPEHLKFLLDNLGGIER